MAVSIIDADVRHLDELEALERQCFSMPWTRDQLMSQLPDAQHEFLAALDDGGSLLGYVGMMFVLDEGYISNVAVAPSARRRGVGSRLVGALLERSARHGLSFVTLEVRQSNAPAIALYEKHGFACVGRRKNYYEQPREDALLMTKVLR